MSALLLSQLVLGYFAWSRGWRGALLFWMALPWTLVALDRFAPDWELAAPVFISAAGLSITLAMASVAGLVWIAVANPQHR